MNMDQTRDLQIFSLTLSQVSYPHHKKTVSDKTERILELLCPMQLRLIDKFIDVDLV